jgi:DNA-binding CsgD family transcriptional regulator
VLHLNHAARAELDDEHPLQLLGRTLRARRCEHVVRLHEAMDAAQRGLRRLLTLRADTATVSIAVIPLGPQGDDGEHTTLLMLGKRQVCERLSVQCFARSHALTPTETRVLEALCEGPDPRDVATMHGVGLATVRSQIGSIRVKTGAQSIRDLVRQVSVLPPMLNALREAAN